MADDKKLGSQSFDELLIRTMSIVVPLPERIKEIQEAVHALEVVLATHQVDPDAHNTSNRIKLLSDELLTLVKPLEPLVADFKEREENSKQIKGYIREAITAIIKYAMLPVTIALCVFLGISPDYNPWKESDKPTEKNSELSTFVNSISGESISRSNIKYIIDNFKGCYEISRAQNESEILDDISELKNKYLIWIPDGKPGFIRYHMTKEVHSKKIPIESR
jgi:hypothetical protein